MSTPQTAAPAVAWHPAGLLIPLALTAAVAFERPFGAVGTLIALAVLAAVFLWALLNLKNGRTAASGRTSDPAPAAAPVAAPTAARAEAPERDPTLAVRRRWDAATSRHDDVLLAYSSYELDPEMLLRYPAMWDLAAPEVMAFHDALDLAGGLRAEEPPTAGHRVADYVAAVDALRSAWARVDRYARSTGTDALESADARDCRRALKLLRHADAATGPERAAYLQQVIGTISRLTERGVVAAAPRIRAQLESRVRLAIER